MNKISLKEILINAKRIYKEQGKVLLKISALHWLIIYVVILASIVFSIFISQDQLMLVFLATMVSVFSIGFVVYYSTRMYASLIRASISGYYGKSGSVSDFYKEAKPVTLRCLGYRFLLALIYALPLGLACIGLSFLVGGSEIHIYAIIMDFLYVIPFLTLVTLFYYVPTITVVYQQPKNILGYSVSLLKGNVLNVMILVIISGIVWLFPLGYSRLLNVGSYGFLGQAGLHFIGIVILWLITPFWINLTVSSMQMVEAKKRESLKVVLEEE